MTADDPFGAGFVISDEFFGGTLDPATIDQEGLPMRSLITAGSYRSSGGHLMGTNCPSGVSCGPGKGHFCTGFSGGYDTYICYCECHNTAVGETA